MTGRTYMCNMWHWYGRTHSAGAPNIWGAEKTDVGCTCINSVEAFMWVYIKSSWPLITLEVYKSTSENGWRRTIPWITLHSSRRVVVIDPAAVYRQKCWEICRYRDGGNLRSILHLLITEANGMMILARSLSGDDSDRLATRHSEIPTSEQITGAQQEVGDGQSLRVGGRLNAWDVLMKVLSASDCVLEQKTVGVPDTISLICQYLFLFTRSASKH